MLPDGIKIRKIEPNISITFILRNNNAEKSLTYWFKKITRNELVK